MVVRQAKAVKKVESLTRREDIRWTFVKFRQFHGVRFFDKKNWMAPNMLWELRKGIFVCRSFYHACRAKTLLV